MQRPLATLIEREFCQAVVERLYDDQVVDDELDAAEVAEVLGACLDEIAERMATGRKVTLRGFGVFEGRLTRVRVRTLPAGPVATPAKLRPVFRPTRPLKERINR